MHQRPQVLVLVRSGDVPPKHHVELLEQVPVALGQIPGLQAEDEARRTVLWHLVQKALGQARLARPPLPHDGDAMRSRRLAPHPQRGN